MTLAESRQMLADVARDVLAEAGEGLVHALSPAWPTVVELGWPLVAVPEAHGGAGGSFADLAALVEATGRHAARVPLAETALARWAAAGGSAEWDPATVATVALGPVGVRETGDGLVLDGAVTNVAWASVAAHIVVTVGERLATVDLGAEGVSVEDKTNVADEPRCVVRFDGVIVDADAVADAPPARVRDRLLVLRAAATVGACETALELAVTHARSREQFGRSIGSFQLVRSAIAEMASEVALARVAVESAVDSGTDRHVDAASASAALAASRAAMVIARRAHQVHGAIGVTREHALHRFTRRLWAWRDDVEPERATRERLGALATVDGADGAWSLVIQSG